MLNDQGNAAAENDMEDTKNDQPPLALTYSHGPESHCCNCGQPSWRTVCLKCERGDGPRNLGCDKWRNGEPCWQYDIDDDLRCDDVQDMIDLAVLEMLV